MDSVIDVQPNPLLSATLLSRRALHYSAGADVETDRPAHVRASSGLAWFGGRIAVIQDDANFVALIEPDTRKVHALPLPAGKGGLRQFDDRRGNKRHKLDLEACFSIPSGHGEYLIVMGSGSTGQRESIVLIEPSGNVQLFCAHALYAGLRQEKAFSGSELNIEGALFIEGKVRLFNRGNGAVRDGIPAQNASCDIPWPIFQTSLTETAGQTPPVLETIVQYQLGELFGVALSFTDAAAQENGLLFTATAETSPNAVSDGEVKGSVIGFIGDKTRHWAALQDSEGKLVKDKIEGICLAKGQEGLVYVVVDADDPVRPSCLCEVRLTGPWLSPANST